MTQGCNGPRHGTTNTVPADMSRRYEFDVRTWALELCANILEANGVGSNGQLELQGPEFPDTAEGNRKCRLAQRALKHVINEMRREANIRNHTRGKRGVDDETVWKGRLTNVFENPIEKVLK